MGRENRVGFSCSPRGSGYSGAASARPGAGASASCIVPANHPASRRAQAGVNVIALVVARTTKAINYRHLSGATKIDFRGTILLPFAKGEAKVEGRKGAIRIQAQFEKLDSATRFGLEFLTYVLLAVSPEGRADNLGEIQVEGSKAKPDVTAQLQAFALIVTAEPYFAVTQPSEVVVLENIVRPDTMGSVEEIDAKFDLLQRSQYTYVQANDNPSPISASRSDFRKRANAVAIARAPPEPSTTPPKAA